jgi:hypothetical protein
LTCLFYKQTAPACLLALQVCQLVYYKFKPFL